MEVIVSILGSNRLLEGHLFALFLVQLDDTTLLLKLNFCGLMVLVDAIGYNHSEQRGEED